MPRIYTRDEWDSLLKNANRKGLLPQEIDYLKKLIGYDPISGLGTDAIYAMSTGKRYVDYPQIRYDYNKKTGLPIAHLEAEYQRVMEKNRRITEQNRIRQAREQQELAERQARAQINENEQERASREQERNREHEAEQNQRAERQRAQAERVAQQERALPPPREAAQQQHEGRNAMPQSRIYDAAMWNDYIEDARRHGASQQDINHISDMMQRNEPYQSVYRYIQSIESGNPLVALHRDPPREEVKEEREAYYQQQDQAEQQARAEQEYRARQAQAQAQQQAQAHPPPRLNLQPEQVAQSPENAAAIAAAMERAQQAANFSPRQAAAAPHLDPSVSSSRKDIDPERARASAEIIERARQLSLQPPLPMPSLRERFAFHTPEELAPLRMAREHGIQDPHYRRAQDQARMSEQLLPQGVHNYMNPYQQHVVSRIAEEGNRNLFENILPTLESRYIKLGQHGSRRHHDLGVRAVRDIQKEISAQQGQALASGYENAAHNFNLDRARQLEASRMHSVLGQQSQASRLADIAALKEAEQESRGFRQNLQDFQQHEVQRIHQHPQEMLNMYSQMVQGQPYSTSMQYYTPPSPQPKSLHRADYQRSLFMPMLTQIGSHFLG